ncbi:hypothetical protein PoMZ_06855 [Pyricularia oryzae]|uniref:Uncharacterized protein n=1 Tax=Pyricularia oryzae TaxID=318829 RepID=A0A4P7NS32_PYROR|nr:hypothetical protein PoMZ_06855 [Pyricularia oryzae]
MKGPPPARATDDTITVTVVVLRLLAEKKQNLAAS